MRDRRVAFLARDLVWEDDSGGSLPFSYAARKLDASLRSGPQRDEVASTIIDLRTADAEEFFERIRAFAPSVVAASTYIWSLKLFCEIAEMVRRWDPSVRFVMGGPAARPSVLSLAPYAPYVQYLDAVVTGEGEEVIRRIARDHLAEGWVKSVPGLQVRGPLGWRKTEPVERPVLDEYASPYQLGTVPHGEIGFLETFRGCPISCAFCQWGEEKADRVHSAEYLAAHLRGFVDAGVTSVYVLDAAFNLSGRAFRNLVQADREVGALKTRQVIGHIYPAYLREEHLAFFDYVGKAEVAIGVQSFDKEVLRRLGRPFDLARFDAVLRELRPRVEIDLEIILGLPGDDPASFRRTFDKAVAMGTSVRVFYCLALPDALLDRAAEFDVDFDPETFMLRSCRGWSAESLREEWVYVREVARSMYRPSFGPNWVDFRTEWPAYARAAAAEAQSMAPQLVDQLRRDVVLGVSDWQLREARTEGDHLLLELVVEAGAGALVLEVSRAASGQQRFTEHEGVAYSYRGALGQGDSSKLHRLIRQLHGSLRPVFFPSPSEASGAAGSAF